MGRPVFFFKVQKNAVPNPFHKGLDKRERVVGAGQEGVCCGGEWGARPSLPSTLRRSWQKRSAAPTPPPSLRTYTVSLASLFLQGPRPLSCPCKI